MKKIRAAQDPYHLIFLLVLFQNLTLFKLYGYNQTLIFLQP